MKGVKLSRKELDTGPFLEMKIYILKREKVEYDEPMLPIEKSCFIFFSLSTCITYLCSIMFIPSAIMEAKIPGFL